ncbi:hypothetical protein B0F90DRAFT_1749029 [Multifurca ochricompacta]|uniref:Rho GTPase-activating protein 39 n=1 Tax=Multifurca ochricompacta TaxID=376703 RepID=A0AAD4QL82_9AGAM|nr:hypothetical protein B0F90DRAFT_1749029 [Multifurca ochricompacta]
MPPSSPLSSPSLSSNAHFSSAYTNGHAPIKPRASNPSSASRPDRTYPASVASNATPEVHINGSPTRLKQPRPSTSSASTHTLDDTAWGSHFWVTLVDPQTQVSFFACPATGQVSWDPPVGNFVLPPSENGEWWEISDESRGGIPYYYHTKTGETVWEKPDGFVIPLTVLQNTALGRRLSKSFSSTADQATPPHAVGQEHRPVVHRSRSYSKEARGPVQAPGRLQSSASGPVTATKKSPNAPTARRNMSTDPHYTTSARLAPALPPIPGSEASAPPTPTPSHRSFVPHRSPPQSLNAAVEHITRSPSHSPIAVRNGSKKSSESGYASAPESNSVKPKLKVEAPAVPMAPVRPAPSTPIKGPRVAGKEISGPVLNIDATLQLSPVKARAACTPILINPPSLPAISPRTVKTLSTGAHPILPDDLASDIQQFVESEFAQQYFAIHRTGFIFKRKVPVGQMMTWQRGPIATPLLNLGRPLHKDAVRTFRAVQRLMGDSEREARWLLGEGLTYGELRDEIYCQVMKQLTNNPSAESTFRGWQLMCVLLVTFPPSKNFEPYLHAFLSQRTGKTEGRVDVLAKHCLKRLATIAKKGPRGKPPTLAEIETASDAAFNPSTFGEPLDAVFRLQERTYPTQRVPIVLPFLADGVLALGGTKAEGIFRVPGDSDAVATLKMRLDCGSYTLEGVDDPHVPASLFKLWLRELVDPLVPSEMYNDCIAFANNAEACCAAVGRLPTANRRVVLFVINFLQLFLDERRNLALVMAPNLLRCGSDSMAVVFNNAQYEQAFVHNLLLHLKCGEIDPQYFPTHGLGAVPSTAPVRTSRSRNRRAYP